MSGVPAFKLVEAGFSQSQVEALAEFMQTEAARRSDLMGIEHHLDARITETKAELKAEIAEVVRRLDARISETKSELKAEITEIKGTQRLHNWMIGFNIGLTLLTFGKLFFTH